MLAICLLCTKRVRRLLLLSRWVICKKNSIILFSKYPKCIMPITDEEQYSLVIEVDTDKTANFEYEK